MQRKKNTNKSINDPHNTSRFSIETMLFNNLVKFNFVI